MTRELFILRSSPSPWGDYGRVLRHGMTAHAPPDSHARLTLERTGPFVPPITFPGISDIVVTDALRRDLEQAKLALPGFREVVKKRIVKLRWEEWDLSADEPERYPAGGEPESYVLGRKHNPLVAAQLGDLWELLVVEKPGLQLSERCVDRSIYAGETIVRASRWGCVYIARGLRDWLERHVPEWVTFEPAAFG